MNSLLICTVLLVKVGLLLKDFSFLVNIIICLIVKDYFLDFSAISLVCEDRAVFHLDYFLYGVRAVKSTLPLNLK